MVKYILIFIILLIIIYVLWTFNSLIKLNNKVKEAFATMDVYLKKRWDLIPNLIETVKGYVKHEKNTLENIILLRNTIYDKMTIENKLFTNEQVSESISNLMILSENYPELRASENFRKLSQNLTSIENEIANSRKYYNAIIRMYNNKVEMFPSSIIANILGYKTKTMFEAEINERHNIKIDL